VRSHSADFDHDGRQEVFLKNRNGPQLRLLKNVMENLPPSIAFHLRGTKSNRDAIGAVVALETKLGRQTRSNASRIRLPLAARQGCVLRLGSSDGADKRLDSLAKRTGAKNSATCLSTTVFGLKKAPNIADGAFNNPAGRRPSADVQPSDTSATGNRNSAHHS